MVSVISCSSSGIFEESTGKDQLEEKFEDLRW